MKQSLLNQTVNIKLKDDFDSKQALKTDCSACFGLCCVALFYSRMDGFPSDKPAGKPCLDLEKNFGCRIHEELKEKGYKGCLGYDCIGAGQKICQVTFKGLDWRSHPNVKQEMFDVLPIMRGLHELLWFLNDAYRFDVTKPLHQTIQALYDEVEALTLQSPEAILKLDLNAWRYKVNEVLIKCSERVRTEAVRCDKGSKGERKIMNRGSNFMGKDMRKLNLVGANLRGALLIASNLKGCDLSGADVIGADMRDANVCEADLSLALFLTQAQLNAAIGNNKTKIPAHLTRPSHWRK
ncbi:MAG TPA: hypothetical protein DCY20_04190 [Firmicutes bacterium]|nr:hypothetical protein [Bacillota bacterium]